MVENVKQRAPVLWLLLRSAASSSKQARNTMKSPDTVRPYFVPHYSAPLDAYFTGCACNNLHVLFPSEPSL